MELLRTCRSIGIKLNKDKLHLHQTEVTYMGHVLSAQGLKPDPAKVQAITEMTSPADVQGVQRLLGMINYLARFLPNLADVIEPLRQLTHQDVEWEWTVRHEQALQAIKQLITSAPVLNYFDPAKQPVLQCDASSSGLGAILLQLGHPVAYASRALTNRTTICTNRKRATCNSVWYGAFPSVYVWTKRGCLDGSQTIGNYCAKTPTVSSTQTAANAPSPPAV